MAKKARWIIAPGEEGRSIGLISVLIHIVYVTLLFQVPFDPTVVLA